MNGQPKLTRRTANVVIAEIISWPSNTLMALKFRIENELYERLSKHRKTTEYMPPKNKG